MTEFDYTDCVECVCLDLQVRSALIGVKLVVKEFRLGAIDDERSA